MQTEAGPEAEAEAARPAASPSAGRLDGLFAAAFGLVGLALGARPIGDNSTFVHLRTGVDIVAGRGIPRVDPYSATAEGATWVVQSWLPAVAYGLAQKLDDSGGAPSGRPPARRAVRRRLRPRRAGPGRPPHR